MGIRKVIVPVVIVCCAAIMFAGCKPLGAKSKKTTDIPELPPIGTGGTDMQNSTAPRDKAFETGTRVADKFENVLFDFDSAQIADGERAKLEAVATYMKSKLDTVVVLEGSCDERGSAEYNMSLGERRGMAARAYLVTLGIDATRMQTRSFGKEKPLNPGHDEAAWRENRRVEFNVMR